MPVRTHKHTVFNLFSNAVQQNAPVLRMIGKGRMLNPCFAINGIVTRRSHKKER